MATIHDIAKAAGVSGMTVSRVLNGRFDYARPAYAKRAARIRKIADELGYRPNAAARTTRTGRFGAVALLLSTDPIWSELPPGLLGGIQEALLKRDLHLVLASHPDRQLTNPSFVPKILRELAADGLLINYNANIPQRMVALIQNHDLPAVWINSKQPHDCVHPDDLGAAVTATKRLLDLGHRRIAFVDFITTHDDRPKHYSQFDRFAGYAQTLQRAGLKGYRIGTRELLAADKIVEELQAHLTRPDRPTALVTYGVEEARSAYMAARLAGLRVPKDLSIVVFADRPMHEMGMHIATMILPEPAVGAAAVEMLLKRIEQSAAHAKSTATSPPPAPHHPPISLPFKLDPTHSLAPPPRD